MTQEESERTALEESILAELREEHERREAQAATRREQRQTSRQEEERRAREEAELRTALRLQFYEENGYRQAVDTTGRTVWLSPSEFALHDRKQRRKRKKHRFAVVSPRNLPRVRDVFLFLLMCGAAVGIGLMLAR